MSADACLMECSFSLSGYQSYGNPDQVCQRFVYMVFVDSPHNLNEDHVKLDFPISLSV